MKTTILNLAIACTLSVITSCHNINTKDSRNSSRAYTLIIKLRGRPAEQIVHSIDVDEKESFQATLTKQEAKWDIAGTVGKIKNGHVSVKITTHWFVDEKHKGWLTFSEKLKLNQDNEWELGIGSVPASLTVGMSIFDKIIANQRLDPIVKTPGDEVEAQGTQGHP